MKKAKVLTLVLVFAMLFTLLAGCGGGTAGNEATNTATGTAAATTPAAGGKDAPKDVVKIGIVNPTTGPLAGFGEGCPWTENLLVDYINKDGGIFFEEYNKKLPIEIVVYDSTSDTTKTAQMAQKLIEEDKVDIIIARHTPETVNPVSAVAERYGVPCVAIEAPVDAWLAEGPYEWTYHSFWTLDLMYKQYSSMWKQAGFGPGTKIGILFANDADGSAWYKVFTKKIVEDGYVLVDPGQHPAGTTDYADKIKKFKAEGVQILCGTNITPDFSNFWIQAKQLGFKPEFVTMGKAFLLESDALAIGADLMDGLCAEVWWSPDHPYKSALTGVSAADLAKKYKDETGKEITQPMGYKYASMELAIQALTNATGLEPENIRDGLAKMDVDTIVGHIKYNDQHYAITPLAGGQWQKQADGKLKLVIVNNSVNPEIPVTGELKKLSIK
jgi:branched-chain amino acid transport system substrate-binding protein